MQERKNCLIHAINFFIGRPYFQSEAQFMKVLHSIRHASMTELLDIKEKKGIRLGVLTGLIVVNSKFHTFRQ